MTEKGHFLQRTVVFVQGWLKALARVTKTVLPYAGENADGVEALRKDLIRRRGCYY